MLWPLQYLLKDLKEICMSLHQSPNPTWRTWSSLSLFWCSKSQLKRWLLFDFFFILQYSDIFLFTFLILLKAAESGNKEAARVLLHHGARCVERDFALHSTFLAIRTFSWWYDAAGDFKSITNTKKHTSDLRSPWFLLGTTNTNTKTHLRVEDRNTAGLSSLHIAARSGQLATTSLLLQNTHQVLASWSLWQH